MTFEEASGSELHHLLPLAKAARQAGIGARLFRIAAEAGQLGPVELLYLGRQRYVRASALAEFLNGTGSSASDENDLLAVAATSLKAEALVLATEPENRPVRPVPRIAIQRNRACA